MRMLMMRMSEFGTREDEQELDEEDLWISDPTWRFLAVSSF